MFCPQCKSMVGDDDRFCPKCGAGVTLKTRGQAAGGGSMVAVVPSDSGSRPAKERVPLVEGGTKYPGLARAAALSVKSGSLLRLASVILGPLTGLSLLLWLDPYRESPAGWLLALLASTIVLVIGWSIGLLATIQGELIYLLMDVEDDLRRHT